MCKYLKILLLQYNTYGKVKKPKNLKIRANKGLQNQKLLFLIFLDDTVLPSSNDLDFRSVFH